MSFVRFGSGLAAALLCVACSSDAEVSPERTTDAATDAPADAGKGDAAGDAGACVVGQVIACYSGPPATQGIGMCKDGTRQCIGGKLGPCENEILPLASEQCDGKLDENCNGTVDEGCTCTTGESRPCYGGPAATAGVGACKSGTQTCAAGQWGTCSGAVLPTAEACSGGADVDCDGKTDCADPDCSGATCAADSVCVGTECKSTYLSATVACNKNQGATGLTLCKAAGFGSCVDSIGYWWFQCAGPGDCPGGFKGLECTTYAGAPDCVNEAMTGSKFAVSKNGCDKPYGATDHGYDCKSYNPGYLVRVQCAP